MKDIQAIARYMRLPEEQLKFPIELLNQGYEPNYLANYRPDELGNIDEQTLSILRRALKYSEALKAHKEKVKATMEREQQWTGAVESVIMQSNTISQVDTIVRHLRSRKNSKSIVERCPQVESVGQAILTMQGDAPKDLNAWVAELVHVPVEQAPEILENTKSWMMHLMSEDVQLMQELQRSILKKGSISVKVLPDPPKGSDAEKQLEHSENQHVSDTAPVESSAPIVISTDESRTVATSSIQTESSESSSAPVSSEAAPQTGEGVESDSDVKDTTSAGVSSGPLAAAVAPLIAEFHQGRKPSKGIKTKTLSDKQLSPRQRRRKWLRNILESYAKLRKPLSALTPYQILMLSRGQRSQIVAIQFHLDEKPLVQACRESLCAGRHPMHPWLMEIAQNGLRNHLLPRLHQDVFSILEEDAHTDLTEAAVVHLQSSLLQRPVRGHRILLVDSIGPKMAAVVIVDADGNVIFTGEIPCNSNRPEIVAQNVVLLGQWIHEHKVTLLALSNGPARRYLVHSISELLRQSAEGSIYWTMVDRAGADGYCMSRGCLVELPKISRRHRAATWLAWRLQDPLKQILKVEPARLRLGSYQRELPQRELEAALQDAVSAAITQSGIDVYNANTDVLNRIPGMTSAASKAVVEACQSDQIKSRENLMAVLREHISEMQARQAIGFLRVYGSSNALDGTTIHPDDYRLAERLVAHAKLPMPDPSPANWIKPDYAKLAEADAAAAIEHAKLQAENEMHAASADEEHFPPDAEVDVAQLSDENTSTDTTAADSISEQISPPEMASAESNASEPESVIAAELTETSASEDASLTNVEASETTVTESSPSAEPVAKANAWMPDIPTVPMERPTLSVDAERLARSWQVGREKLRRVANCLQFPFEDSREFQYPVPLQSRVPRLDNLQAGTMLQALVIGVADFGVFADLGPECSGLIHISRLGSNFVEDPHQFVQVGDLIPVWVLNVDTKKKRVALTAIPPGSQPRRSESNVSSEASRDARNQGRDQRTTRSNVDRESANKAHRGSGGRTSTSSNVGNGPTTGHKSGDRPSRGNDSRGGDSRGNRGSRPFGRDSQRGRGNSSEPREATPRRAVRIDPVKPVTPISDAMQQGKEPLRSFSDLLQFMQKNKEEVSSESKLVQSVVTQSEMQSGNASAGMESALTDPINQDQSIDHGDTTPPPA